LSYPVQIESDQTLFHSEYGHHFKKDSRIAKLHNVMSLKLVKHLKK